MSCVVVVGAGDVRSGGCGAKEREPGIVTSSSVSIEFEFKVGTAADGLRGSSKGSAG